MSVISPIAGPAPCARDEIVLPHFRARYAARAGRLPVHYRCVGAADLPVVAVLGGISANAEVVSRPGTRSGWWDAQVGPGLGVDTYRYRVLSFDYFTRRRLGGTPCRAVATADQADVLAGLLHALGIRRLHAIVGASYGAMVALAFALRHPLHTKRLIGIGGAHCAHPFATALRALQRRIIRERGGDESALALARALALTTYLTPEFFAAHFSDPPSFRANGAHFSVEDYLAHHGHKYATCADAGDYLDLSESLDLHAIEPERVTIPATLIAVASDRIVPLAQMRELAGRLSGPVQLHVIKSDWGHDAFLHEHEGLRPLLSAALTETSSHDD